MWSRYADTPRDACFHYYMEVNTREHEKLMLKLRQERGMSGEMCSSCMGQ